MQVFADPFRRFNVVVLFPNIPKHFPSTTLCFVFVPVERDVGCFLESRRLYIRPKKTEGAVTFRDSGCKRLPSVRDARFLDQLLDKSVRIITEYLLAAQPVDPVGQYAHRKPRRDAEHGVVQFVTSFPGGQELAVVEALKRSDDSITA